MSYSLEINGDFFVFIGDLAFEMRPLPRRATEHGRITV